MQKIRLEAHIFAKANIEAENKLNSPKSILEVKTAQDTNDKEDFFDDLRFLNIKSLKMIVIVMVYKWRGNNIHENFDFLVISYI